MLLIVKFNQKTAFFCNVDLFVCCHLFCICAYVMYQYLILVQGPVQNHHFCGFQELNDY